MIKTRLKKFISALKIIKYVEVNNKKNFGRIRQHGISIGVFDFLSIIGDVNVTGIFYTIHIVKFNFK